MVGVGPRGVIREDEGGREDKLSSMVCTVLMSRSLREDCCSPSGTDSPARHLVSSASYFSIISRSF